MRRVCVFCGAATGHDPAYRAAAVALGEELARRNLELVYGGGGVGLMGAVADGVLSRGGVVTGVITRQLVDRELAHNGASVMHVVETMHERKMRMATTADAFIAMPGGLGTLDELFEILAWAQLGIHSKPVGLLDVGGFFSPIAHLLSHIESQGFLRLSLPQTVATRAEPAALLDALVALRRPCVSPALGAASLAGG